MADPTGVSQAMVPHPDCQWDRLSVQLVKKLHWLIGSGQFSTHANIYVGLLNLLSQT